MARVVIKTLKRKKLFYGKFTYRIDFRKQSSYGYKIQNQYKVTNCKPISEQAKFFEFLDSKILDKNSLVYGLNRNNVMIIHSLFLTRKTDAIFIKMHFPNIIYKMYEISLDSQPYQ